MFATLRESKDNYFADFCRHATVESAYSAIHQVLHTTSKMTELEILTYLDFFRLHSENFGKFTHVF